VLDEKTLVIPDRPGNQRFDTLRNLFQSPRVGLIFLIPGKRETLRIGGRAEVVRDAALLESLNAQGKVPTLAIAVHVDEAFFHCSKCMIRSHLWQHEQWAPLDGLPTLAETMKDAAAIAAPVEVLEGVIKEDEEQPLLEVNTLLATRLNQKMISCMKVSSPTEGSAGSDLPMSIFSVMKTLYLLLSTLQSDQLKTKRFPVARS
jgi:hypothetical protein